MRARQTPPSLLRRLFEAAGYRIEDRPLGLRAIRQRDRRGVFLVEGVHSPEELIAEFPPDIVRRTLVYPEDPGPAIRTCASECGMEILDSSTLGPGLGEILLLPVGREPHPEAVPASDLGGLEPPANPFPEWDRIVAPRLGRPEAESLAGVDGFRYVLRLLPYYLAPYRIRVPTVHGGVEPPADHLVAVNALTGEIEIWEEGERELISQLIDAHEKLEPVLSERDCREISERELRKRHTVNVDHLEQHGGAIVIERRRVAPGPGDLRIGVSILVHVPFWFVESWRGRLVLNAVTGSRGGSEETALGGPE